MQAETLSAQLNLTVRVLASMAAKSGRQQWEDYRSAKDSIENFCRRNDCPDEFPEAVRLYIRLTGL